MAKTVQNPMTAPLDGGAQDATNLNHVALNGHLTVGEGVVYLDGNHNRPTIRWVNEDPRTDPRAVNAQPGSLALEFSQTPALWVKTGPTDSDWKRATLETVAD